MLRQSTMTIPMMAKIFEYKAAGLPVSDISKLTGLTQPTIRRYYKQAEAKGFRAWEGWQNSMATKKRKSTDSKVLF